MGDTGLELSPQDTEKTRFSKTGAAESGAVAAQPPGMEPDLAAITAAWPSLSKVTRKVIIRLIEADRFEDNDVTRP